MVTDSRLALASRVAHVDKACYRSQSWLEGKLGAASGDRHARYHVMGKEAHRKHSCKSTLVRDFLVSLLERDAM